MHPPSCASRSRSPTPIQTSHHSSPSFPTSFTLLLVPRRVVPFIPQTKSASPLAVSACAMAFQLGSVGAVAVPAAVSRSSLHRRRRARAASAAPSPLQTRPLCLPSQARAEGQRAAACLPARASPRLHRRRSHLICRRGWRQPTSRCTTCCTTSAAPLTTRLSWILSPSKRQVTRTHGTRGGRTSASKERFCRKPVAMSQAQEARAAPMHRQLARRIRRETRESGTGNMCGRTASERASTRASPTRCSLAARAPPMMW